MLFYRSFPALSLIKLKFKPTTWKNKFTLDPVQGTGEKTAEGECTFSEEQIRNFPHSCIVCRRRFVLRRYLKRHEKIHLEKHLDCKYCSYQARRKDKLHDHMRRVHPETAIQIGIMTPEQLERRKSLLEKRRSERQMNTNKIRKARTPRPKPQLGG